MPTPQELLYREIPLTKGQVALVDAEDFERINAHKWHAIWHPSTSSYYAQRLCPRVAGQPREHVLMHREILGLERGDKRQGDHRTPSQTLDNRKENLRIATCLQNRKNGRKHKDGKSGLKGATWVKASRNWQAAIRSDGKNHYLGRFPTAQLAHEAYCKAAVLLHGEFARFE